MSDPVPSPDATKSDAAEATLQSGPAKALPTPAAPSDATVPLADGELSAGRAKIGRYRIVKMLGRGGMGTVVAAYDPELDRKVAVKILVDQTVSPAALGAALRREAQALARVHHGNVLAVYDAGVDGSPYLVMQLIEGETLGAYIKRVQPSVPQLIAVFLQAARGLAAIHAAGLIHRDFKPSNALVDAAGVVWVSDLGLARIGELAINPDGAAVAPGTPSTVTNTVAGTPAYMAPEQFGARELTAACDQFSFCVVLWEALFGERPFKGTSTELAPDGPPPAPKVLPPGLTKRQLQALQRGIAVNPAKRWPSMNALIAELAPPTRAKLLMGAWAVGIGAAITATVMIAAGRGGDPPAAPAPAPIVIAPGAGLEQGPPQLVLSDARRLTYTDACDEFPSYGPDGTIYYDGVVGPDAHLMAIDPRTRTTRELTTTKGWDLAPAPSPDGTQLAFVRKTDEMMAAYVAPLADLAAAKKIVPGGFRPMWSPDGRFVWAGGRKGIARYAADTLAVDRSLELPAGAYPMAGLELGDGRVVLLVKVGSANADGLAIYDAGATTSRWLIKASDDTPMDEVLVLAPDGAAVLVARYSVTFDVEIWRIPLDGSPGAIVSGSTINARKRLSIRGSQLAWSDCTDYGTIAEVTQTSAGATKFIDVARNKWMDYSPVAIPGGTELVFVSYRSQTAEIWRMKLDGRDPRVVPFGGHQLDRIVLSHDGKLIAGANGDGLFVGPLDGSTPPIKLLPGAEATEHNASFSRDSTQLYIERKDGERDRIAVIPVAGGTPTWVLPAPSLAPAQSPTADLLAYLALAPDGADFDRVVMVLDQKTGRSRRVAPDLAPYPYRDLRWHPDGTKLLAARRDGQLVELELATGKVLRTFDVGADQLFGLTYAGDTIFVGRATAAGDIWEADLRVR